MSIDQPNKVYINANDCVQDSQGIYSFTLPTQVYNAKNAIIESCMIIQSQFTLSPNQRNIQFSIGPTNYNLTLQPKYYTDISDIVTDLNTLVNSAGPLPGNINFSFNPVSARVSVTSNTTITIQGWNSTNGSVLKRLGFSVPVINLNNNTYTALGIPQLLPTVYYDLVFNPLYSNSLNITGGQITSGTGYRIPNTSTAAPGSIVTDNNELDRSFPLPPFSQYSSFNFYFTDDYGDIINFPPLTNHSIVLTFEYN